MIRALTSMIAALLASTGPETVELSRGGAVNLTPFVCNDTPRSSLVQRVCYDEARNYLLISARGELLDYCGVPPKTVQALVTAPSMGQYYRQHFEHDAGAFACAHLRS